MRFIPLALVLGAERFVPCAKAQQLTDFIVTEAKLQQRARTDALFRRARLRLKFAIDLQSADR